MSERISIRPATELLLADGQLEEAPAVANTNVENVQLSSGKSIDVSRAPNHIVAGETSGTEATNKGVSCLPAWGKENLRGECLSFLEGKFDEAYNIALKQARLRQVNTTDENTSELVFSYRREQQHLNQTELERLREKLEVQFQEERRQQRHAGYQRWAKMLQAQQSEKKVEYQTALQQYYIQHGEERSSPVIRESHGSSLPMCLAADEEAALHTPAESIRKDQLEYLHGILHRLHSGVRIAEEEVRHSASLREVEASVLTMRVKQQYLSIIAGQQEELKMLHIWQNKMQRLLQDAEESIVKYAEQRYQRQQYLRREKWQQLSSDSVGGGGKAGVQGGSVATSEKQNGFRRNFFEYLL